MILGIVLLVVGLVWMGLIHVGRLSIQLRGAAVVCAGVGFITILFETFG